MTENKTPFLCGNTYLVTIAEPHVESVPNADIGSTTLQITDAR